ncbi:MAG: NADH-quinone oxidoreductase subunit N, partial [Rhodospirillaceae bacterium]|nr:NADH-quinone oxidoreductase subunit N [Rhodospirillaceae bacterium]
GMLFYMLVYIFMNLGTFAVILSMRVKGRSVEDIRDLSGIGKTNPGIALALTALMFSMTGIPPLAGFWAKYFIFTSAVNAGLVGVAVFGVLTSVVGAYYYLRLIKIVYFDASVDALDKPDGATGTVMFVCTAALIGLFVFAGPFAAHADAAAKALFPG